MPGDEKKQIPRAIMPRDGTTIIFEIAALAGSQHYEVRLILG
jgi:hypothetical protein